MREMIETGRDPLYGISAIGTKICVYQIEEESGNIGAEMFDHGEHPEKDTAPAARWELDVMTVEGRERLLDVVEDIKTMRPHTFGRVSH